MGKESLTLYAGTGQEGFSVQAFRNIEISQIKALANVLYNEDLVSETEHWDLCLLMKSKIDQIWDDLESVIRSENRRPSKNTESKEEVQP